MLQSNARLLKVTRPSEGESYDGPAAPGPTLYEAATPAAAALVYLRESRQHTQGAEANVKLDRLLLVDSGTPAVEWTTGDLVTFERLGVAGPETAAVDIVQRPMIADPEIPADLVTVRLTLRPA